MFYNSEMGFKNQFYSMDEESQADSCDYSWQYAFVDWHGGESVMICIYMCVCVHMWTIDQ